MRHLIFVPLALLYFPVFSPALGQTASLAVLPFSHSGTAGPAAADAVAGYVLDEVVRRPEYRVAERSHIKKVIDEQKFQRTGLTEEAVEVGRLLAVDYIVTGEVIRVGDQYTIALRLISVETGRVAASEKRSAAVGPEHLGVIVKPAVEALFSGETARRLNILIKGCVGLYKMDVFSHTDAWIQVFVGDRLIGRTGVVMNDPNPVFNASFEVPDYAGEPIVLVVYDHDLTRSQLMGRVTIPEPKSGLYQIIGTVYGRQGNMGQVEVYFQ